MLSQAVNKKLQELNQAQAVFEQTKERSDAVQKMIQDKQPTVKYKET